MAANSSLKNYSKEAKNYFFVWPRDGVFVSLAAKELGLNNISDGFFDWLKSRAEDWKKKGIFYENYHPNGLKKGIRFQPDQTGAVLYALAKIYRGDEVKLKRYKTLIRNSANGICKFWRDDHFKISTNDIWEERITFPDLEGNFLYSLASCIKGLEFANKLFPNEKYVNAAKEMKKIILVSAKDKGYFIRMTGEMEDARVGASSLGLIWPFGVLPLKHKVVKKTLIKIEKDLIIKNGLHRYQDDRYDGWMQDGKHRKRGAGYWPLLNFWLAIIYNKQGNKEIAMKYYNKVINDVENYIPEQIFENKLQESPCPLAWSHAMFVLATKELKIL